MGSVLVCDRPWAELLGQAWLQPGPDKLGCVGGECAKPCLGQSCHSPEEYLLCKAGSQLSCCSQSSLLGSLCHSPGIPGKSQCHQGMDGLGTLLIPSCTGVGMELLGFSWDLILLHVLWAYNLSKSVGAIYCQKDKTPICRLNISKDSLFFLVPFATFL